MDWRKEESELEKFMWDDDEPLSKSESDVNILNSRVSSQNDQDVEHEDSRYVTAAFERLGLFSKDDMLPASNSEEAKTCICGCMLRTLALETRQLIPLDVVVRDSEVLNCRGAKQAIDDIAPYWKKDSRMWLWKSVRLARRKKLEANQQICRSSIATR